MTTPLNYDTIIAVQSRQLRDWESVLKPEVFELVKARTIRDNNNQACISDPNKIFRGTEIDCFVSNLALRLARGEDVSDGKTYPY